MGLFPKLKIGKFLGNVGKGVLKVGTVAAGVVAPGAIGTAAKVIGDITSGKRAVQASVNPGTNRVQATTVPVPSQAGASAPPANQNTMILIVAAVAVLFLMKKR